MLKFPLLALLASCLTLQAGEEPPKTRRELQFENEQVRVWKTTILPQPLKMHRHDKAPVVVGLKGGVLINIEETGEESELIFDTGKAYWLEADPPGTLHGDINVSDEPIEVMVIEMKSSEEIVTPETKQTDSTFKYKGAMDIGSGSLKLFVAKTDGSTIENDSGFSKATKIPFSEDLAQNGGNFSAQIEEMAFKILSEFVAVAKERDAAIEIRGMATEAFRQAPNGELFLAELGQRLSDIHGVNVHFSIVEGEEESKIGFESVIEYCPTYTLEDLIVFESGSGSIQVSFVDEEGQFRALSLPLGTESLINPLMEKRGEFHGEINPVALDEVEFLADYLASQIAGAREGNGAFFDALDRKLTEGSTQVIGIGFGGVAQGAIQTWNAAENVFPSTESFGQEDMLLFLSHMTGKMTEELEIFRSYLWPDKAVTSVSMLYGAMRGFNFKNIAWKHIPAGAGVFHYLYTARSGDNVLNLPRD
jgi:hypothetical protein